MSALKRVERLMLDWPMARGLHVPLADLRAVVAMAKRADELQRAMDAANGTSIAKIAKIIAAWHAAVARAVNERAAAQAENRELRRRMRLARRKLSAWCADKDGGGLVEA